MSGTEGLFQDIAEYIRLSKDGIDLARSAWSLLPKSNQRDEAERKLSAAEQALARSDAALALKLGYSLCQCTYPPRIMLWHEKQKQTVCPNQECGRVIKSVSFDRPLDMGGGDSYF